MAKKAAKPTATVTEISYAEHLYCEKKMSPQAIATEFGRNIKTIYAWRDKNRWDETKDLLESGPLELKKILLKEATRIAKGEKRLDLDGKVLPGIDADALSKVMKAYDYMSKKLSPEVFSDAFMEFNNWMTTVDAKVAFEFTKYEKMFLMDKISQQQ